jgi:glutamate-1-semialdehyde 2,1-aminomutase
MGEYARSLLAQVFDAYQAPFRVTGLGSLFNIHATREMLNDYRLPSVSENRVLQELVLELVNEGCMLAPRGMGCISTPMTRGDIGYLAESTARALEQMCYRVAS